MTQIYTPTLLSPLHERPSLFPHRQDQYTPRSLQHQPQSQPQPHSHPQPHHPYQPPTASLSPTHSEQHFERNGGGIPQPRPPVSELQNGSSSPKVEDMYQTQPQASQKREQLPPISSLFGAASQPPRPSSSAYTESTSLFPPVSPRHPTTPNLDRPYDGSYSQRPIPPRPYSSNSRPEQTDRFGLPPPPRPAQVAARSASPRTDPRYFSVEGSRPNAPTTANSGSPGSQSSRPEYFSRSRDTSSSFRPHHGFLQHHMGQGPEPDHTMSYHESHHAPPLTPSYPPTPASTVSGDPTTTKDGLGPKIWTGTQFLPRFVRQAEVPGEGMCYFYDDGTHCKISIDGEAVNAHWGVTKAGKPRKRLAIACITCREKKIKCDPDYPRCVQCEKFGRLCKFKNAPRGGQGSPDTPPADPEDSLSRPTSSRADRESIKGEKRESQSVSPRQALRQATPDSEIHHSKRPRLGYNEFTPLTSEASPRPSVREALSPAATWSDHIGTNVDHSSLAREWHVNPFDSDPTLVTELISVFFKNVPENVYCMFPEGPFKAWVLSSAPEKSLDDLMLVYTILALSAAFSFRPEFKSAGARYASISRYACANRHYSLQLVQSRLILALYYFADHNQEESWDFSGAALRAASGLRLNIELGSSDDVHRTAYPYGLTRAGFAECRRRTFWSCYLMDRFNGFSSGYVSIFNPEDIFLRLPSDTNTFEAQVENQNAYFEPTAPAVITHDWRTGSMAYLINITTIWGDVMANIYRSSQRPAASNMNFIRFYDSINLRLNAWVNSLPSFYTLSPENLARAASGGKLGTLMTMHTVYHATAMKLNRYIQKSTLTKHQLDHHVSLARHHAEALLGAMDILAGQRAAAPANSTANPTSFDNNVQMKFSSPFVGYTIVSAVDILTAKFTPASIPARLGSITGAQYILSELALFWQSAKNQKLLIQQRIRDLDELANCRQEQGSGAVGFNFGHMGSIVREIGDGTLEIREALEKTFPRDHDCVYT